MRKKNYLEKELINYQDYLDRIDHILNAIQIQVKELNDNYKTNRILTLISRKKIIKDELGGIANKLIDEALKRDKKKKKRNETNSINSRNSSYKF